MGSIDLCSLLAFPLVSERSIAVAFNWNSIMEGGPVAPNVPPLFVERETQDERSSRKRVRLEDANIKIESVQALRSLLDNLMTDLEPKPYAIANNH